MHGLTPPTVPSSLSRQVLVKVFQTVLLDSADHDHLKAFYMIVPALCLSWTDAALQVPHHCPIQRPFQAPL